MLARLDKRFHDCIEPMKFLDERLVRRFRCQRHDFLDQLPTVHVVKIVLQGQVVAVRDFVDDDFPCFDQPFKPSFHDVFGTALALQILANRVFHHCALYFCL